jgi:small GTP-binding protein
MAKTEQKQQGQVDQEDGPDLPPGVKLLRSLEGHEKLVSSLAFDPQGETLASGSGDNTVKLWEVSSGQLLRTLKGHSGTVSRVTFDPSGRTVASASADRTVKRWMVSSGDLLDTLEGHQSSIRALAFDPENRSLATGGDDNTVKLWDARNGKLLLTLVSNSSHVYGVAFHPQGETLATVGSGGMNLWKVRSGKLLQFEAPTGPSFSVAFDSRGATLAFASLEGTVMLCDVRGRKLLRILEGHTDFVDCVAFSADGRLLASRGGDQTIRLWSCETWETVAVIPEPTLQNTVLSALAFHPTLPMLAAAGSKPGAPNEERSRRIHLWELDYDVLLGKLTSESAAARAIHHTTGKIVLVGDHSVGKSALGYRLINGRFETQESTHGQKFWVFPALGKTRADGTDCEAILWDFAGQPDYRLVHALFVDNADLALVLFDASELRDPLHGVGFWLKQLQTEQSHCPIILVAAQTDRGSSSLTPEELNAFCKKQGIVGPIATSAATGEGIEELIERMKSLIPWEDKAATVTTTTFKRVKDYILGLKEEKKDKQTIVTPDELRVLLQATDAEWQFTDAEMMTAVGHLENYGYVKRLRTSKGETRILLQPERLNNLASSFVLEARRHPKDSVRWKRNVCSPAATIFLS